MENQRILITGGAGFIGSNLASRLAGEGRRVTVFDNLSRPGCAANIDWLFTRHGPDRIRLIEADLSNIQALGEAAKDAGCIYHLAGQVAVTTSLEDPRADFESNALGTLNVLEAARLQADDPIVLYASTNKVYGDLGALAVVEEDTRYVWPDRPHGVAETQPVDFHSPYGCSKGCGDQYVRDYHRIYGLRTVVARQSCIYGPRQLGVEDQGWMAWFVAAALRGLPIEICGDGKQVRDALYVDDLLNAYEAMTENIETTAGQIYNIGGGPLNTISIWKEFGPLLHRLTGHMPAPSLSAWRPGDQPVFVSDIRKAQRDFGWSPQVSVEGGVARLVEWIGANLDLFDFLHRSKEAAADVKNPADRLRSAAR